MQGRRIARGLGWFGIGLGLAEVFAPDAVARAAGLQGHQSLIRAFGVREIGSGMLLLAARDASRWLWVRAAGDGLDGALLGAGLRSDNPHRERTLMAICAVAPVVALDLIYSFRALRHTTHKAVPSVRLRRRGPRALPSSVARAAKAWGGRTTRRGFDRRSDRGIGTAPVSSKWAARARRLSRST